MADFRYNVMHEVDDNELRHIHQLLDELSHQDTLSILVDHVNERTEDRIQGAIDRDKFDFYTRGINEDDTEFVVRRKM
ncbi:hypothetical protein [Ammoniphilus sp. YIM 78166]|uniref:hypothetical protein n=1 Tax=Ammoniphilus sp. YIM 78166 TaxID=1644106 RepID=UPI00106F3581|nr:hypothetical protein [Ammoniphilus sp. YIM 78166]